MTELVKRAKNGDKEAFTNLVISYQSELFKIARAKINNVEDINDVIQETMLIAFDNVGRLKDETKFKAWIIKILINECNRFYKSKKIVQMPIEEYTEGKLDNVDDKIIYEKVLSYLKPDERIIILLHYVSGYTSKEIAEILSKNENTIKTKIKRIKEKLYEKFEGGV